MSKERLCDQGTLGRDLLKLLGISGVAYGKLGLLPLAVLVGVDVIFDGLDREREAEEVGPSVEKTKYRSLPIVRHYHDAMAYIGENIGKMLENLL